MDRKLTTPSAAIRCTPFYFVVDELNLIRHEQAKILDHSLIVPESWRDADLFPHLLFNKLEDVVTRNLIKAGANIRYRLKVDSNLSGLTVGVRIVNMSCNNVQCNTFKYHHSILV